MSTQVRFDEYETDDEQTGANDTNDGTARDGGTLLPQSGATVTAGRCGLSAILAEADPDIEFSELHRRAAAEGYVETPDTAAATGGGGE